MPHIIIFLILFLTHAIGQVRSFATEPLYLGAYMNVPKLFSKEDSVADRERSIIAHLDKFKASGLRVVMPYVNTTSGLVYYPSNLISNRPYGDWDPLAFIIAEAKKRDLEVCPVIVALVCGHKKPSGILKQHPEWALRDKDGVPVGHISPANPEARDFMVSLVKEVVANYKVDGILLDYLRFPNAIVQLDPAGQRAFEKSIDGKSDIDTKRALQEFKEQSLSELARRISAETRRTRPGTEVVIYSWGPHVTQNHPVAQDWKTWAREGLIDRVEISGYCFRDNYGERYLQVYEKRLTDALELARGTKTTVALALGIRTSHGDLKSAEEIDQYLQIAARLGVQGVGVFTWDYLLPYFSAVTNGNYFGRFEKAVAQKSTK